MQQRMRTHLLSKDKVHKLLSSTLTGSLATLNNDGSPYVTPVHFLYNDKAIYIHGLPKGQKIDNIKTNSQVCMAIYQMDSLLLDPNEKPCDTNTKYESVIISGKAKFIDNLEQKKSILAEFIKKYTPHLAQKQLPDNMVKSTAVIKIEVKNLTGKYYN